MLVHCDGTVLWTTTSIAGDRTMASLNSRVRSLAFARAKRMKLMVQCHLRGIPTKVGHHSTHEGVLKWHGPTTMGRMRRKLIEAGFMPVA